VRHLYIGRGEGDVINIGVMDGELGIYSFYGSYMLCYAVLYHVL
jgi:hypothetical protein